MTMTFKKLLTTKQAQVQIYQSNLILKYEKYFICTSSNLCSRLKTL